MTCREVLARLSLYLDGELPEPLGQTVARHLEQCPSCRAEGISLAKTILMLRAAVPVDPPRDYRSAGKEC